MYRSGSFILLLAFSCLSLLSSAQDKELIIRQGHRAPVNMVIYSPDGRYIFSAGEDRVIKMWDVNTHNRFTINYNMGGKPEKFKVIGTANNIESESKAAATWSNLKAGKTYEWYAVISDGTSETTGPRWRFNTTAP